MCNPLSSPTVFLNYLFAGNVTDVPFIANSTGTVGTGGGNITIIGSLFSTGCNVGVGAGICSLVAAGSRTSITCSAPANDVGAQALVVMCGNATSNSNVTLLYVLPTLSGIAPSSITIAGNVSVTVSGRGFGPACSVTIAGKACNTLQAIVDTAIVCLAPANPAGAQKVAVKCGAYVAEDLVLTYGKSTHADLTATCS